MMNFVETLKSIISFKNKNRRFKLKRPYQSDIIFDGHLIAKSGGMQLYKTTGGNFVCNGCNQVCNSDIVITQRVIFTKGETEEAIQKAIFDCFGYCKTARKLYKRAGIDQALLDCYIE